MPHTSNTTQQPTSMPPPSDFSVNGTEGPCLRITASMEITLNGTKGRELQVPIPPPPATKSSGVCSTDRVDLTLRFHRGKLSLTFIENSADNVFYLGVINVTLIGKDTFIDASSTLKAMVTPLGHSFSCHEVKLEVAPGTYLVAKDVRAQAFRLHGFEYGTAFDCSTSPRSMTVPIIVGIVLAVLILVVVLAYVIGRRQRSNGYQPL
ncbi:macrosialin [Rhinophrynus dorsalis]